MTTLLLAADTSSRDGSIALAEGHSNGTCGLIEMLRIEGGAFSAQLVPQIAELLCRHHFSKTDIAGFVVVSGPGSFTGLRVGLAAVKALAEVLRKPVAAVSLLEALAVTSGMKGTVFAAIPAGRKRIYLGEFIVLGDGAELVAESVLAEEEIARIPDGATVVSPDSPIISLAAERGVKAQAVPAVTLDAVAAVGWRKIAAGRITTPEELEASYISGANAETLAGRTARRDSQLEAI